ncbi:MAG: HD domain-containing protein [candidate division WOR-3 bacterium]|nr:HD domain-containing protein [candidate division WOR-3 bacterium]
MDRKYIEDIFPQIDKIENKELRDGVVKAWLLAIEKGKWDKIDDVPFTLLAKVEASLIEHTRTVTDMAMAIGQTRKDLDMDVLIAGALVHDVGKLLEYERQGTTITKSGYGKLVRHPVSGYGLVLEAGLPVEVAHIVAAHSKEGESVTRSPEAIIIHHCDFIDFDIAKTT